MGQSNSRVMYLGFKIVVRANDNNEHFAYVCIGLYLFELEKERN